MCSQRPQIEDSGSALSFDTSTTVTIPLQSSPATHSLTFFILSHRFAQVTGSFHQTFYRISGKLRNRYTMHVLVHGTSRRRDGETARCIARCRQKGLFFLSLIPSLKRTPNSLPWQRILSSCNRSFHHIVFHKNIKLMDHQQGPRIRAPQAARGSRKSRVNSI